VRTAFERLFQGSFGNTACDTPQSALNILTRVYIPTKEPLIYPNTFANACTTLKIAFDTPKIAFDTPKTALNTPKKALHTLKRDLKRLKRALHTYKDAVETLLFLPHTEEPLRTHTKEPDTLSKSPQDTHSKEPVDCTPETRCTGLTKIQHVKNNSATVLFQHPTVRTCFNVRTPPHPPPPP